MFFHLKSILCAIIFLIIFEIIFVVDNLVWYAIIFLILFSILNAKKIGRSYSFAIIPVVFSLSSVMLFYLIHSRLDQQAFIIISSLFYYFIFLGIYRLKNYEKDQTAKGILSGGMFATIFFFYSGFYGLYLNFSIPLWFLMFIFLAMTFFLSYCYLRIFSFDKRKTLTYSLILGLAMTEISWIINFWPFGYLTTGVIALIFYYMFWDLAQSYFTKKLSKNKIIINLVFFSLLIGLILWSSRWQLAV